MSPWNRSAGDGGSPQGRLLDLTAIFVLSMAVFVALILWFDNAQGITSNGVFKAVTIKAWVSDPANASLETSNYLYYPVMALFCRLLDAIGAFPGDPRHQLTIINAFSAALCLCIVYLLVRRLTGRRSIAWAAAAFHLSGAFFLNLAIINEDIMPSYTLMFASMALASLWFARPTARRVALVSALFTIAWLFEWRLMFPTLPAMLLALAVGPGRPVARLGRIALFLGTMVGLAQIAVWLWGPQNGNPGPVLSLLWTGKGTAEGWAGFSMVKVELLWAGMAQYLAGGANIADPAALKPILRETLATTFCIAVVAVLSLLILWRDRASPQTKILAAIFGVTFAAGEVMNLYSQPQDPQMQINVMVWLTIGWALILAVVAPWRPLPVLGGAMALTVALFAYNASRLAPMRGTDAAWREALPRIERNVDPTRTVFLLHGFESDVSELFYAWGGDWTYFDKLGPAPTAKPKFKLLALVNGPLHTPNATGEELAKNLKAQIERVMDLGYDVVANVVWTWSEAQVEASLATVADKEKAKWLYRALHENFTATPTFSDPLTGPYFRLQRR
jgi:hypothetical protein